MYHVSLVVVITKWVTPRDQRINQATKQVAKPDISTSKEENT
jgi:hypothetical protein